MMLLGFKTQLIITNNATRELLAKHAGVARHAWNWGLNLTKAILDNNQNNPENKIKFPTAIDLHKWLVAIVKPDNPWYYEVSKCAPQYALRHLRDAWQRCFQKTSGVPKFKKKYKHDSFTLDGSITVDNFKIKVPIIGWLKTYERLPQGIKPKSVTISREADKWYISFNIEIPEQQTTKIADIVGVDLGVLHLATLSNGEIFEGAKALKLLEKKLAKLQYRNRHKVIHSSNWRKAQVKIARLHQRIANIRKDYVHKMTTYLAKNHGKIVIEDLNVSGMLANHKLAKAISDGAFYEIKRQLIYKCELYGSELIIADRWFPSSKICSHCGTKKESLLLSERMFYCEHCHIEIDRDLNAALNLAKLGGASSEVTSVDKKTPKSLAMH
jgi:putative transposase